MDLSVGTNGIDTLELMDGYAALIKTVSGSTKTSDVMTENLTWIILRYVAYKCIIIITNY